MVGVGAPVGNLKLSVIIKVVTGTMLSGLLVVGTTTEVVEVIEGKVEEDKLMK